MNVNDKNMIEKDPTQVNFSNLNFFSHNLNQLCLQTAINSQNYFISNTYVLQLSKRINFTRISNSIYLKSETNQPQFASIPMSNLLLDERLVLWVFFPIIYITLLISVFRYYMTYYQAQTQDKKTIRTKSQFIEYKDKQLVAKCDKLVQRSTLLTREAFDTRRSFLCKPDAGYLEKKGTREPNDIANNMANMQSSMMDGMKGNFMMMGTTIPAMMWINSFFSGFLPAKVPFSLTQKFRSMTQSGINLENLDVSYVSGVSFYFLIMFGLGQVNNLFLKEDPVDEEQENQGAKKPGPPGGMGANPMMGGPGMMGPNMMNQAGNQNQPQKDIFKPQIEALELVNHKFAFEESAKYAITKLRALKNGH